MGAPIDDKADIEAFDAKVAKWIEDNPNKRFSDYSEHMLARHLELGRAHASLGTNLNSGKDWTADGKAPFKALCDFLTSSTNMETLPRNFIVCDYGCGTLRLGWHLMQHLYMGGYCGLDLSDRIIDFGRRECESLIAEKAPLLGSFKDTLPQAAALNPDLVFAFNVACHVHPEEIDTFYENIKMLCSKSGAIAIVHFITHKIPDVTALRYQRSGWAWPLEQVKQALHPLECLDEIRFAEVRKGQHDLVSHYLVMQRP